MKPLKRLARTAWMATALLGAARMTCGEDVVVTLDGGATNAFLVRDADFRPLLRVQADRMVGVGTGNAKWTLHVVGNATNATLLVGPLGTANGDARLFLAEDDDGTYGMSLQYDGTANTLGVFGHVGTATQGPHLVVGRDGNVGIGTDEPPANHALHVRGGRTAAALNVENTNAAGIGMVSSVRSSDVNAILGQHGAGDFLYCDAWDGEANWRRVIRLRKDGSITGGGLSITGTNSGVAGATVQIANTNAAGIAMISTVRSSDVNAILSQKGAGDFLYCDAWDGDSNWRRPIRLLKDGTVECKVLSITGGSDLAEPFDVGGDTDIQPGMVVCIDAQAPGRLRLASQPYDRRVAGVVSGAGGVNPGVILRQSEAVPGGRHPVALSGRVYCLADASQGAIEPGDLLTTSGVAGYAMKASDLSRASGAVLGKAMSALESGQGLVLVLVCLQ